MDTKMRVDLSQAPWAICDCGNYAFNSAVMFKKVSALISPTGKEEHVPIEIVTCTSCGKIPTFISKSIPDLPSDSKIIS